MTSDENTFFSKRFLDEVEHVREEMARKAQRRSNRRRDVLMVAVGVIIYLLWHIHKDITEIGRALGLDW